MVAEFNGDCALAASIKKGGEGLPRGREDIRSVANGKTYFFSNKIARAIWRFTFAPSGKFLRWLMLLVVLGALVWSGQLLLS